MLRYPFNVNQLTFHISGTVIIYKYIHIAILYLLFWQMIYMLESVIKLHTAFAGTFNDHNKRSNVYSLGLKGSCLEWGIFDKNSDLPYEVMIIQKSLTGGKCIIWAGEEIYFFSASGYCLSGRVYRRREDDDARCYCIHTLLQWGGWPACRRARAREQLDARPPHMRTSTYSTIAASLAIYEAHCKLSSAQKKQLFNIRTPWVIIVQLN